MKHWGGGGTKAKAKFKDTWKMSEVKEAELGRLARQHPAVNRIILTAGECHGDAMKAYLIFMAPRLIECHRILERTGSIYLHCDDAAAHYLKLVMDAVFGRKSYRNEICWQRTTGRSDGNRWGRVVDTILFYSRSDEWTFHRQFIRSKETLKAKRDQLTGAGTSNGESGKPWRGYDPNIIGRHWSAPLTGRFAEWIEDNRIPGYRSIKGVHDRLDALDDAGLIHWTRNGTPQLVRPAGTSPGVAINSIWTDIKPLAPKARERTKYPTQKPLKLLERIIRASSNEGDMVFDPFCGCATTLWAAERLNRRWAGIDREEQAVAEVIKRIRSERKPMEGLWHGVKVKVHKPAEPVEPPAVRPKLAGQKKVSSTWLREANAESLYGK